MIRLSTPIGLRYEQAYEKAYPFNQMVEGMLQKSMVRDAVHIAREAVDQGISVVIAINNRIGGNAPILCKWWLSASYQFDW